MGVFEGANGRYAVYARLQYAVAMSRDCVVGECLGVGFALAAVAMFFPGFLLQSGVVRRSGWKLLVKPGTGSAGINTVERIFFYSVAFSLRPVLIEPPFAI